MAANTWKKGVHYNYYYSNRYSCKSRSRVTLKNANKLLAISPFTLCRCQGGGGRWVWHNYGIKISRLLIVHNFSRNVSAAKRRIKSYTLVVGIAVTRLTLPTTLSITSSARLVPLIQTIPMKRVLTITVQTIAATMVNSWEGRVPSEFDNLTFNNSIIMSYCVIVGTMHNMHDMMLCILYAITTYP